MGTLTTIVSLIGLSIAVGSLLLLGYVSGVTGGDSNLTLLGVAIGAFLFGIFLFGWSMGKRTQY